MTCNESDDKAVIVHEIEDVKSELHSLGEKLYYLSLEKKFLTHKLYDLQYSLRQIQNGS